MSDSIGPGSVVLLTGGSAGIGEALALRLADRRARLALAARGADGLERVAEACRQRGAEAAVFPTDVSDEAQCRAFVADAVERFGRADVLVNNAGISMWARFDELDSLEPLRRIMDVNYFGAVACTHAALPHLKASRGRVVTVASLTGKTGVPTRSGYAASKHALAGFFDSLRIELRDTGVSVTTVYPGFVATGVRRHAVGPDGQPLGESPVQEDQVMTADACARQILDAADKRRRELVMTARGKVGVWAKLVAPALVDRLAARAIERGV
jgi:short-subunit dehydrogenase